MNANYPDSTLPPFIIVDDSEDDVFLLRHRLRDGGITNPIHSFDSAAGGLAFMHSHCGPAVVFTDIRMPGESGFAFISAIRANPDWDANRIVVVSSSNRINDLMRAVECGANGYLVKFPPSATLADFLRNGPWISLPRSQPESANSFSQGIESEAGLDEAAHRSD